MWETVSIDWHVIGVGDFNGDGLDDILWRHDNGAISNWLGTANGDFTVNDANAWHEVSTDWQVPGVGDFNGDGHDDLLWRSNSGSLSDWLSTTGGGFVVNDANAFTTVATNWQVVGVGDFNGDGRSDILWRNDLGQVSNWLGQANGGFVSNDQNAFTSVPTNWLVAGIGDFDGDGKDDILWRNDLGQISNWLGQANGGFVSNDQNAFANAGTDWIVAGVGDFNGDGRDDILWRHQLGTITNWLATETGGFAPNESATVEVNPLWSVSAVGDFNGDQRGDILWRNTDGSLSDWFGTNSGGFIANMAPAGPFSDSNLLQDMLTAPGSVMPTVGSNGTPSSEAYWTLVAGGLQLFFDEVLSAAFNQPEAQSGGGQNSYYDDHSGTAPWVFSWNSFNPAQSYEAGAHYFDFLREDIDPEFTIISATNSELMAQFVGGTIGFYGQGDGSALVDYNGLHLIAIWRPGETHPGGIDPVTGNPIVVVTGGSWVFEVDPSYSGFLLPNAAGFEQGGTTYSTPLSSHGEPVGPYLNSPAGHMFPGSNRHLTEGEIDAILAMGLGLTAEQLSMIVIREGGAMLGSAATTWSWNTISVSSSYALNDFSGSTATMGLLIHELYHSIQWLSGLTPARFLADEMQGLFRDIYAYTQADLDNYYNLNVETQAQIQEDAYRWSHGGLPPLGAVGEINYTQLVELLGTPPKDPGG